MGRDCGNPAGGHGGGERTCFRKESLEEEGSAPGRRRLTEASWGVRGSGGGAAAGEAWFPATSSLAGAGASCMFSHAPSKPFSKCGSGPRPLPSSLGSRSGLEMGRRATSFPLATSGEPPVKWVCGWLRERVKGDGGKWTFQGFSLYWHCPPI